MAGLTASGGNPARRTARGTRTPTGQGLPGQARPLGTICVLDNGHKTSMEELHWGRTSEGQPITWAGSTPDNW
ncbi:hypothetical protein [Streptomyces cinereoruber]|uniref:hypothetical protein n=1 Tax=Streptomyces cinereoruber TaxID=67260 RepID=UPI003C2F42F2